MSFSEWPIELGCWVVALVLLYFTNSAEHHHTLCPLGAAGFSWCPGCGLGRSITLLMHGHVLESLQMHIMGIPVFIVLLYRIYMLTKKELRTFNQ